MKIRLDQYLVQHGLIQSRERAKAMIMPGVVFVNEHMTHPFFFMPPARPGIRR